MYLVIIFALSVFSINAFDFNCINESSCSYNGFCFNETKCICFEKYGTKENNFNRECNYIKRSQRIAFLLSFFLGPIGIDQIYMGNALLGSMKFIISLLFILTGMGLYCIGKIKEKPRMVLSGKVLETIGTLFIIVWWFIDWILILSETIRDSNGQLLHTDL